MKYYIQTINGVMTKFTMKDKLKYILPKLNDINKYYNKSFTEEQFIEQCEREYDNGKLVFRTVDNYIKQLETKLEPVLSQREKTLVYFQEGDIPNRIVYTKYGPISISKEQEPYYKDDIDSTYRIRAQERLNRILNEGEQ